MRSYKNRFVYLYANAVSGLPRLRIAMTGDGSQLLIPNSSLLTTLYYAHESSFTSSPKSAILSSAVTVSMILSACPRGMGRVEYSLHP